jgi:transcriptional regulator with XRE-family HTH domain
VSARSASSAVTRLGDRLREARLNARLTVREAAERIGLRAHGTLVQYEHGTVLPPLERLAALATVYHIPLASLVVSSDALVPVITMLERATPAQLVALMRLLEQALGEGEVVAPSDGTKPGRG